MSEVLPQTDPDQETGRRLLEAAVAEARADRRPSVPHDQVRAEMLREIERLRSKPRRIESMQIGWYPSALDDRDAIIVYLEPLNPHAAVNLL
jgi:hypothetical protein